MVFELYRFNVWICLYLVGDKRKMKEIIEKVLSVILWIVGFPIIVIVLGIFIWGSYLIEIIND